MYVIQCKEIYRFETHLFISQQKLEVKITSEMAQSFDEETNPKKQNKNLNEIKWL